MTAPANGSAHAVLDDACRRAEHVLASLLDDRPTTLLDDSADVIATEVAQLKSARALADARAKQGAANEADMGGATLTLSLEEVRTLRAALLFAVEAIDSQTDDGDGAPIVYDGATLNTGALLLIRKRINAGISRNCERRTSNVVGAIEETYYRPAPAEACADSDDETEASET